MESSSNSVILKALIIPSIHLIIQDFIDVMYTILEAQGH